MSALDRAVWSALTTRQAAFARGDARAVRLAPEMGLFAAAADGSRESQAALGALVIEAGELWLIEPDEPSPPPGTRVVRRARIVQMVASAPVEPPRDPPSIARLGEADAREMLALATLTAPGPFFAETPRFGGFLGVRREGRLVAMAGERLRPPSFTEVSGVCTHPDDRGRGHAGALMRTVARAIQARVETPFLTAYADNTGAIGLYRSLGFAIRTTLTLTVLARVI